MRNGLTFIALSLMVAVACSQPAEPPAGGEPSVRTPPPESSDPKTAQGSDWQGNEPADAPGEVPANVIARLRTDLATHAGAEASTARVVSAEAVTWHDGSLGCGEPGRFYTQALVPGYRVVFEVGGRTYAYHAARKGHFVLCRKPTGPISRDKGPISRQLR